MSLPLLAGLTTGYIIPADITAFDLSADQVARYSGESNYTSSTQMVTMAQKNTLGAEFDNQVGQLSASGVSLDALFFNGAGLAIMDALFQTAYAGIQKKAMDQGWYTGCCQEPGCGRSDMADQAVLFDCLDTRTFGVRLSESSVISPSKSIASWIPMADHPIQTSDKNKCLNCSFSG